MNVMYICIILVRNIVYFGNEVCLKINCLSVYFNFIERGLGKLFFGVRNIVCMIVYEIIVEVERIKC